ncbi:MAG TPA: hypothetical protein DCW44_06895 [Eubacterium sp.]|nr:hypothetical protein [Eubacterium sp.]
MAKLNIVVVSAETQYKVTIKNKISDPEIAIVGYADYTKESRLKIEGYTPDVVVCVASSPVEAEIFKFIEGMHFQKSGCSAVIVTDDVNVNLVNKAARIGVRQVIDINSTPDTFCQILREVNEYEQEIRSQLNIERRVRSKVISFFGSKGGTGKSTVAANVASALAKKGSKVLLLDFDFSFGDQNLLLDLEPKDTVVELVQDPEGIGIEKVNSIAVMHSSGVVLLAAPKSPEYAEYVSPEHVSSIIENVRPYYEYVIIDISNGFSDQSIVALENSDEIMLVGEPDILSLKEAKETVNILDQLQQKSKIKVILNKNTNGLIKAKDYEKMLDMDVYSTIGYDYSTCAKATNKGQPFVLYSTHSVVARDTMQLVERIVKDKVD